MFSGFNLSSTKNFSNYVKSGETIYKKVQDSLDKYFDKDGIIKGEELEKDWFPQIEADIFISHSHKDEQMAKGLAGWLYENFGLKVFIDSCVWGYSLDLQKKLDDRFCLLNGEKHTYSYEKVMYSTSHVHMMLSTALTKMIDKSECVIFLNTPQSISTENTINKTESPWIYHEIVMTKLINKKKLSEYRKTLILESKYTKTGDLKIKYDVDLDHLVDINDDDLNKWKNTNQNMKVIKPVKYPLDILYQHKKILS